MIDAENRAPLVRISPDRALMRARRDLVFGSLLKAAMFAAALAALVLPAMFGSRVDTTVVLLVLGVIWAGLSAQSARSSRLIAGSPSLIAAGRYEAAEQRIQNALRSFSIFRGAKMLSLHHLATLRHAEHRFQDAATLSRGLLAQRRVTPVGLGKASQLILADSLLELNDLPGVRQCIEQLYRAKLSLGEAMELLVVQLDYESRAGLWPAMMKDAMSKVSLAELMPGPKAARSQALLALAAKHVDRADWAEWLRRRAELLTDPEELIRERPMLKELWDSSLPPGAESSSSPVANSDSPGTLPHADGDA